MKIIKLLGGYTVDEVNSIMVEKDTERLRDIQKMQDIVQEYFVNVLELPCPDFTYNLESSNKQS
jgi:predicted secreted protein